MQLLSYFDPTSAHSLAYPLVLASKHATRMATEGTFSKHEERQVVGNWTISGP